MRSIWLWSALGLGSIVVAWGGWYWVEEKRYGRELEQAEADLASGRIHVARQRLVGLMKMRPKSGEVAYQLGLCEEKLGHLEAAITAWSGVGPDSPVFIKASIGRVLTLMNSGRYSPAEELLATIPRTTGPYAAHVRQQIELLLRIEGRTEEARDLIVEAWRGAADPSDVLKRLYVLENTTFPVDFVKLSLKLGDPRDERVWLGRANLAIWLGQFDEARRWLDAYEERRPTDQPASLARLSLGMASGDVATIRRAVKNLSSAWFLPFEVLRLRARLAAFLGREPERRSLLSLVAEEPGNTNAWSRLAELALAEGKHSEAATFRKKQAEMSVIRGRYTELIMKDGLTGNAGELGRLAKELGRPIEARGWSLIHQGRAATEPLWPDKARAANPVDSAPMLAAVMEDVMPDMEKAASRRPSAEPGILPAFTDDASSAGLRFFHDNGHTSKRSPPPETACGGVGLLDFDGDGWLDVFAVQGGPFPPSESTRGTGDRLFRNRGDGTFEDATERSGLGSLGRGYGHGVTIGDFDNDGRPDLFVTRWRSYALYRNKGDGRFEDVTTHVGLAGGRDWPTSAAFADLDGDGDLDLYVCHYLVFDPGNPNYCGHFGSTNEHKCMPRDFPSLPDHVFRNDNGRFVDVTTEAGFVDPDGRGLGVVAANLDDDNKIDLYVANDMSANYLFHNFGGLRFEEKGEASGTAASADGLYKSGMGIACGDLDGDDRLDLAVTNFFGESTTFYRNVGGGLFMDHSAVIGLLSSSRTLLGFGIAFADVNNDGWLDLLSTNGHVLDSRPRIPWTMPLQLMIGGAGGQLVDVSDRAGEPFTRLHIGRGLAVGDLDNDGRLDAIVLNQNEPLVYLHNRTEKPGHFIRFRLEGTKSNRDGVGARVMITCGGRRRVSERIGGGSYQSSSDPRLHFGLGTSPGVESVEVRWPSGQIDRHAGLIADREYWLREGATPEVTGEQRVKTK
jgi:enediyne biosynthesis protein E4